MFTLIDLPYKSLAPVISDETLSFHHGKHLQGYVDNLNKLIVGSEFESLCHSERSEESVLEEIVKHSSGAIFNNAGQILNHNMYFSQFQAPSVILSEAPSVIPSEASVSPLMAQITKQWGSLDAFKSDFETKGVGLFGSGWVWLQADASGELSIAQYAGADNPVAHGFKPILTFDVWEHAYYLDYQNRRAVHLNELWKIVDWRTIEVRYSGK
jgi:Fe-Mn family superoxide dismutase